MSSVKKSKSSGIIGKDAEFTENCLLWHLGVWNSVLLVLEGKSNLFTMEQALLMNDYYGGLVFPLIERTSALIEKGVIPPDL